MDTCTVETGLLRKKPCGQAAATHCMNCEQALCAQHALPELTATGKHSGKFLCKQCQAALRDIAKSTTLQPAAPAKKPAPPAQDAPAKAAPGKEAPAESKPAAGKDEGGIDFTPTKK
ncbi:MAG: hypothetical protein ACREUS_15775 [Burkholderiales bacterium]